MGNEVPSDDRARVERLYADNDALRRRVELLNGVAEESAYRAHFAARDAAAQESRALAAEARLDDLRNLAPLRALRWARDKARRGVPRRPAPAAAPTNLGAGVDPRDIPIVVIVRDRLDPLVQLETWLVAAGHRNIVLVDNASTYPPLVRWLDGSTHRVVRLPHNLGHRAPWLCGVIAEVGHDTHFVVTDPDVVPDAGCPHDAVAHFRTILDASADIDKVGFGLRIDDLPDGYALAGDVRRWESQYWRDEVSPGVYRASIDTTFALYRPGRWHRLDAALRTGPPYVACHLPWYADSEHPTDEERYYAQHADPSVNHWDRGVLPSWMTHASVERR